MTGFLLTAASLDRERSLPDEQVRATLVAHWQASASEDIEKQHDIYADDAICDYPQSGEMIPWRHNLQALREHHPGRPSGFEVKRQSGAGDLWVTEYTITYEGRSFYTVSIMEFRAGKVIYEAQYFAEPFPAPAWRRGLVSAMPRHLSLRSTPRRAPACLPSATFAPDR
jgi:hypothetical protein